MREVIGVGSVVIPENEKLSSEVKIDTNLSEFRYVVEGDPIPLARPRFGRHTVWDKQKKEKFIVQLYLSKQHNGRPMLTGPLAMDVIFYFKYPQRISTKKKHLFIHHDRRPDLSNLIKFIEDVATGIVYADDCIISKITAYKQYGDTPKTIFTVRIL